MSSPMRTSSSHEHSISCLGIPAIPSDIVLSCIQRDALSRPLTTPQLYPVSIPVKW